MNRNLVAQELREILSFYKNLNESSIIEVSSPNENFSILLKKDFSQYKICSPAKTRLHTGIENLVGLSQVSQPTEKTDFLFYPFSWHYIRDYPKEYDEINKTLNESGVILIAEPNINNPTSNYNPNKINWILHGRKGILKQNHFDLIEKKDYDDFVFYFLSS